MVREEINIDLAQVKEALTRGLAAADPSRAEGLATLMRLTEARDQGLVREHQRLSRLLPADDPRLASLAAKLETSRDLTERVAFEAKRSDGGLDRVDPKAWTLQGFVFVKDETWLRGKAVALVDSSGAIIANTETDLDGNKFVIRHAVPTSNVASKVAPPVFVGIISISGRRRRPVFLDTRPLRPQNGRITYVEVNIGVPPSESSRPGPAPTDPVRPRPRPDANPSASPGTATNRRATGRRRPAGNQEPSS
jgi:hypothetical protein